MNVALHRAEQLFPSLQRRFNLRQEMEEAARMEAMESRNRGDDTVGQYSQNSGSTAKLEKDVHTNGDSEACKYLCCCVYLINEFDSPFSVRRQR